MADDLLGPGIGIMWTTRRHLFPIYHTRQEIVPLREGSYGPFWLPEPPFPDGGGAWPGGPGGLFRAKSFPEEGSIEETSLSRWRQRSAQNPGRCGTHDSGDGRIGRLDHVLGNR